MPQFTLATLSILVVIAACPVSSVPHIVGGGFNTKNYPGIWGSANNNLLNSALSDIPSLISGSTDSRLESLTSEDQSTYNEIEDNRSASYNSADDQPISVRLPPRVFSGMDRVNPFIRNKRQACQMTNSLVQTLVSRLDSTTYLGQMPQRPREVRIPENQPNGCPSTIHAFASRTEEGLRSNCPWKLTRRDLGADSYPRYVAEAVCLCTECLGSPMNSCRAMYAPVTYFQLQGCQDGMALMVKKITTVAVGCFCASPSRNSAAGNPSSSFINLINDN